jgi:hypothetical protein
MNLILDSARLVVWLLVAFWLIGPLVAPKAFGVMLNEIDQGRFGTTYYEYDYTKDN